MSLLGLSSSTINPVHSDRLQVLLVSLGGDTFSSWIKMSLFYFFKLQITTFRIKIGYGHVNLEKSIWTLWQQGWPVAGSRGWSCGSVGSVHPDLWLSSPKTWSSSSAQDVGYYSDLYCSNVAQANVVFRATKSGRCSLGTAKSSGSVPRVGMTGWSLVKWQWPPAGK